MTVQATDQVDTTVSDDTSTNEEALLDDDLESAFDDEDLESGGEEVESKFEAMTRRPPMMMTQTRKNLRKM